MEGEWHGGEKEDMGRSVLGLYREGGGAFARKLAWTPWQQLGAWRACSSTGGVVAETCGRQELDRHLELAEDAVESFAGARGVRRVSMHGKSWHGSVEKKGCR